MRKLNLLVIVPCLLVLSGCFKTAEQIRREKMLDGLAIQMVDNQKLTAESTVRLQNMEERLSLLNGTVEETGHKNKQNVKQSFNDLQAEFSLIRENHRTLREDVEENKRLLSENKSYLEKLLKTLNKLTGKPRKKKKSSYQQAVHDYRTKNYKRAWPKLVSFYKNKKYKGKTRAQITYYLGMISFRKKKFKDSLIYFSQLFTEHPRSPLNTSGLLHLGRAFDNLGQKDQAKQAFETLLAKFPKTKYRKTVEMELKKLQ
ncbi:MAG: tetratricopeptide repeat protein [Bacteriovoracaceae bacterium]|nr:tetratricopeptide repeat protein [Bacteriovoracaceae bacterium]